MSLVDRVAAASALGVNPKYLRELVAQGYLPAVQQSAGKKLWFRTEDIERVAREGWPGRKEVSFASEQERRFLAMEAHRLKMQRWRAKKRGEAA